MGNDGTTGLEATHPRSAMRLVAFLLGLAALSGCSTVLPGVYAAPFFRQVTLPDGTRDTEFLGPFGFVRQAEDRTTWGVRPLLHVETLPETGLDELRSLWPLLRYHTRGGTEKRWFVFPLFYHIQREGQDGPETDWALVPLLFGGREGNGETYFAFFPFFGTLKNFFARDEVSFFAFPLYLDVQRNDYRTRHFLWPLILSGRGEDRRTFRFLPFYGYDIQDGVYDRRTALWPFFHWQNTTVDEEAPADEQESLFFFFPFYGSIRGPEREHTTVLWPLFSWSRNEARSSSEENLPWPIYKKVENPEVYRKRFWPFWGTYRSEEIESTFWMWPLFYDRKEVTEDYEKDSFFVIPFYVHEKREATGTGESVSYQHLWPLFRSAHATDGSRSFAVPQLLPWRTLGPFEEDWGVLWKLYEARRQGTDTGSRRAFLSLYDSSWSPEHDSVTIPFLYDHFRVREKSVTSWLLGLLRWEKDGAERSFSFLWLPPLFRWTAEEDGS